MSKSENEKRQTFMAQMKTILKEKGFNKECYSLNELAETIAWNAANAKRKVFFYKWFGLFLLISIPLISAFLSIALTTDNISAWRLEGIVLVFSFALTVLTISNSILRPSERFVKACRIGIEIQAFKSDFLIGLEKMEQIDEATFLDYVHDKREEFKQFQEQLIGLFLPEKA